jgi:hypothetical protein
VRLTKETRNYEEDELQRIRKVLANQGGFKYWVKSDVRNATDASARSMSHDVFSQIIIHACRSKNGWKGLSESIVLCKLNIIGDITG